MSDGGGKKIRSFDVNGCVNFLIRLRNVDIENIEQFQQKCDTFGFYNFRHSNSKSKLSGKTSI